MPSDIQPASTTEIRVRVDFEHREALIEPRLVQLATGTVEWSFTGLPPGHQPYPRFKSFVPAMDPAAETQLAGDLFRPFSELSLKPQSIAGKVHGAAGLYFYWIVLFPFDEEAGASVRLDCVGGGMGGIEITGRPPG